MVDARSRPLAIFFVVNKLYKIKQDQEEKFATASWRTGKLTEFEMKQK
jgi:hypothetical protein